MLILSSRIFDSELPRPSTMDLHQGPHHTYVMAVEFSPVQKYQTRIKVLFTDIDDTLTDDGLVGTEAYNALWSLHERGIRVVPVTGRPAGWCEMIARQWPVDGIVGENGGFYFRYDRAEKRMKRHFAQDESERADHRAKLNVLERKILREVPGSAVASDQFTRLLDLAIDFCEDVERLPMAQAEKIKSIFEAAGAQARISSIHVNGWFGTYNKLSESLYFLKNEFGIDEREAKQVCAFVGDSPNDEPMWGFFPNSFAVANIREFANQLKHPPRFVTAGRGGAGFSELAKHLLGL